MHHKIIVLLSVLIMMVSFVVSAVPRTGNTYSQSTQALSMDADNKGFLSNELPDGYYAATNKDSASDEVIFFHKDGAHTFASVFLGENDALCLRADVHENILDGHGVTFVFAKNKEGYTIAQDLRKATVHFDLSLFVISGEDRAPKSIYASDKKWWEKIHDRVSGCVELLHKIKEP